MISFNIIIGIFYVLIILFSYPYLRNSYFPNFPSILERAIVFILALLWIISMPVTFIMKQNDGVEIPNIQGSYESFVGTEQ